MKYYYLSREGPFGNNIVSGKDFDRINRDKSKIVITRINGNFYVLICKNGNYEKEKLVLSYFINSLIKKDDDVNKKDILEDKKEDFYAISDNNMYKLEAFIDRSIVKKSICTIYG